MKPKTIALVIPSLAVGGMERVMSELANYYAEHTSHDIHLIKYTKGENGYEIHPRVKVYEPSFQHRDYSFLLRSIKIGIYYRKLINRIKPDAILGFGDKYNAFTILYALGSSAKIFISNRMNPNLSNGRFIDILNKLSYPLAAGLIAQTVTAKNVFTKKYKTSKIAVIGNPFQLTDKMTNGAKKKVIINVGRFDDQKNQDLLVRYFNELDIKNWKIYFLGDGHKRAGVEDTVKVYGQEENVKLLGNVTNIQDHYNEAAIFAFTSTSEGFPNALGEAMASGCACISFNCIAGPSDLIDDGINGFLVKPFDHEEYKKKLKMLIDDSDLRREFGMKARDKMKIFSSDKVAEKYLEFILED